MLFYYVRIFIGVATQPDSATPEACLVGSRVSRAGMDEKYVVFFRANSHVSRNAGYTIHSTQVVYKWWLMSPF